MLSSCYHLPSDLCSFDDLGVILTRNDKNYKLEDFLSLSHTETPMPGRVYKLKQEDILLY